MQLKYLSNTGIPKICEADFWEEEKQIEFICLSRGERRKE